MGRIEVEPGVKLFVQDIHPEGREAIVFLHGWPLNHKTFKYQYNIFLSTGIAAWGWTSGASDSPISRGAATATTA